jgi:hypothetical protein
MRNVIRQMVDAARSWPQITPPLILQASAYSRQPWDSSSFRVTALDSDRRHIAAGQEGISSRELFGQGSRQHSHALFQGAKLPRRRYGKFSFSFSFSIATEH